MMPERAKPIALGLALAFMVRSYFNSEAYTRGSTGRYAIQFHEELACEAREEESREQCLATLTQALIPTKLSCMSSFRDVFVCRNPVDDQHAKSGCPEEDQQLSKCLQTNLTPYGFSDEEIFRLIVGKQRPRPKPKPPSVEVANEGGEKSAGQRGENSAEKGAGVEGKEDGEGGSEPNRDIEAPGRGDRPNVEGGPTNGKENPR